MARAAVSVYEQFKPEFIDINMGCPAPKIVNNGEGSSLMKNPKLCYDIVKAMKTALDGACPLTFKIRRGFDKDHINAVEVAKMCEEAGADAVFVHARTREQMYMPPVDYSVIRDVKKAVGETPVIGNGDITSGNEAVKVMEYTGCDGVMIGRAAQGNPYVFDEINCFFKGKEYTPVSLYTKKEDIKQHIRLLIEDKGEYIGIREARKHVAWYMHGLRGAAEFRRMAGELSTLADLDRLLEKVYLENRDVIFER
jgi:nifR3 family TIM-barrel protein